MSEVVTTGKAAEILKVSRVSVHDLVKAKRIRGEIINGRLIINSEDVHALALENQKKMARVLGMSPQEGM